MLAKLNVYAYVRMLYASMLCDNYSLRDALNLRDALTLFFLYRFSGFFSYTHTQVFSRIFVLISRRPFIFYRKK